MARVLMQTNRYNDPVTWAERHEAGEYPDALPYGLDRLEPFGHQVEHRSVSPRSELPAKVLRAVGHRWDWWGAPGVARRSDVDVNLCWDERTGIPTGVASRSGSPALVTGVIWLTDEKQPHPLVKAAARRALTRAQAVWALSSAQMPAFHREFGVAPHRSHRLGFGIDAGFWSPERASTTTDDIDTPRVLTVGNDRDRDHALVVRALAAPARAGAITMDLVTELQVEVPADVGRRRTSVSHVELRNAYSRADVVALALRDNLHVSGMTTLLEAQAMGRPVVCTHTPGMSDYVVDGVTGVLVPPGDADAFRRAVTDLAADPGRAAEMGRAGRRFVLEKATTDIQAEQMAGILAGVS